MGKKAWIITLVGVGVVIAVVIGLLANSQSVAETQYCNSVDALQSSITTLTSTSASSLSQDQVQSDIDGIQSAWGNVKSDASHLHDLNSQDIDSAWDSFESAVKDLNNGGSTEDVQNAAKSLGTAAQSNADSVDCGNAPSTTTTSS